MSLKRYCYIYMHVSVLDVPGPILCNSWFGGQLDASDGGDCRKHIFLLLYKGPTSDKVNGHSDTTQG